MERELWRRVRELFEEALELPGDERDAFLRAQCGDDRSLRDDVERLLAAQAENPEFLEDGPATRAVVAEIGSRAGTTVGPYRLEALLGRGGMGEVYRARSRSGEVVALKVVRADVASAAVLRRFDREREILGRLEHPYIVGFTNAGSTDDGLPFLVMELVDGVSFDVFCGERLDSLERRLALLLEVLEAVSHAHSVGVLHRDLKPANVLVDGDGMPRLLDFGVAKLVEAGDPATTTMRALTPRYAAPEQLLGRQPTERSDVYSLGVMLGEVAAECATVDGGAIGADTADGVPPGLASVVRKATADLPEDRYASVAELAADIRRWLQGKTPVARRQKRTARLRRWATRVAAVLLVAAAIAAGALLLRSEGREAASLASTSQALITWPGRQRLPRLSPDGRTLAFVSDRGAASELWLHELATGTDTQLLAGFARIDGMAWGPEGRRLAVAHMAPEGHVLGVLSVADRSITELTRDANLIVPVRWTPGCLFELRGGGLWCRDPETGDTVAHTPASVPAPIRSADVTPDGRHAVLSAVDSAGEENIWIADLESGSVRGPLVGESRAWSPRWADPRGTRFMYLSSRGGHNDIWMQEAAGGAPRFLTAGGEREMELHMAGDGTGVVTTVARESADLWHIGADGREQQWTADSREVLWPDFHAGRGELLFHRSRAALGRGGIADTEIFVAAPESLRAGRVAASLGGGLLARWAPHGRRLLFARWQPDQRALELWLRDVADGSDRRLADGVVGPNVSYDPLEWSGRRMAWSPSGDAVVYVSSSASSGAGWAVRTRDVSRAGSAPRTLREGVRVSDLRYSADGARLALALEDGRRDTLEVLSVTDGTVDVWHQAPGRSLRLVGWRGGDPAADSVLVLQTEGAAEARHSTLLEVGPGGVIEHAALAARVPGATLWDPERERIYYLGQAHGVDNILVFDLGAGVSRTLTDNAALGVTYTGLSFDGADGLFVSRQDVSSDLWLYRLSR